MRMGPMGAINMGGGMDGHGMGGHPMGGMGGMNMGGGGGGGMPSMPMNLSPDIRRRVTRGMTDDGYPMH